VPSPIRMVGLWTIAAALAEASAAARAWRASAAYVCAVEAAESVGSFGSSECLALTCLSSVTLGCRRSTSALGGALRINFPAQRGPHLRARRRHESSAFPDQDVGLGRMVDPRAASLEHLRLRMRRADWGALRLLVAPPVVG
jgi:hypothetical protein